MEFMRTKLGYFFPVTSNIGLKALKWQQNPFPEKLLGLVPNRDVSRETINQLNFYFAGALKEFSIPMDFSEWSVEAKKWFYTLYKIPYGETISYQELACRWGNQKASRAAGLMCKKNPIPIIIPCHRITSANKNKIYYSGGSTTGPAFKDNIYRKQWLINLERKNFNYSCVQRNPR